MIVWLAGKNEVASLDDGVIRSTNRNVREALRARHDVWKITVDPGPWLADPDLAFANEVADAFGFEVDDRRDQPEPDGALQRH